MRVGVTGASGLIGSALVEALRERGDEVVSFVRTSQPRPSSVRWDPAFQAAKKAKKLDGSHCVWPIAPAHEPIMRARSTSPSRISAAVFTADVFHATETPTSEFMLPIHVNLRAS